MPEMTPVAQNVIPPDPAKGISTLSGILGIQQQQQQLRAQTAEATQAEQRNSEMQKAQALVFKGTEGGAYDDGKGGLDRQKLANDILKVAPTYGQPIIGNLLSQANEVVSNRQALQSLNDAQRKQVGEGLQALATKPDLSNTDLIDWADRQLETNPDPAFRRLVISTLTHLPHSGDSKQLQGMVGQFASQVSGAPVQSASSMDTGGQVQPGATNRYTGEFTPAGKPVNRTLAPTLVTSPVTGGQAVVGGGQGTSPAPIGGPSGQNPWQPYPGQQHDIETFRNEVNTVRQEAQQAPLARNINAQILRLSKDAKTGPGSDVWQHVVGAVGAPFGLSPTSSYQEVGKFLEKNAIAAMQAMGGPPSDSRLEAAAKANGGTSFSPEALQTVTKFNDATNTALDQYRQGIDHAVGMGGNVDYSKLPAFKAAWAKNFDVDVFRVENAIRDGDTGELAKIKKDLGADKLKKLAEKRRNLTALSQGAQ
jgi:hypothetical protein